MIQYLYQGTLTISEDRLIPMLALANEYNIHPLKDSCINILGSNINESNLFSLLAVVDKYNSNSLKMMISSYMALHFNSLLENGTLLQLDLNVWKGWLVFHFFLLCETLYKVMN